MKGGMIAVLTYRRNGGTGGKLHCFYGVGKHRILATLNPTTARGQIADLCALDRNVTVHWRGLPKAGEYAK